MSDVSDIEQFEAGEILQIDGELFEVDYLTDQSVILKPNNENGHGELHTASLSDRFLFTRRKGIDPQDVKHYEVQE